jgi:hypothetical protein
VRPQILAFGSTAKETARTRPSGTVMPGNPHGIDQALSEFGIGNQSPVVARGDEWARASHVAEHAGVEQAQEERVGDRQQVKRDQKKQRRQ